jgi:hypothetical protein
VAVTPKGAAVLFAWFENGDGREYETFDVYKSLKDAAGNEDMGWAAIEAIERMGVPVEELDI